MKKKNIVILGAAGRDFHNFNVCFRNNSNVNVVAFTATQIPDIAGRKYPPILSGSLYPKGIPILDEIDLEKIIKEKNVDECVLSYSDLSYSQVMHLGSRVISHGATFSMLGAQQTMLDAKIPVIAVTASNESEKISEALAAGMNDFIAKPIKVESIKQLLIKWFSYGRS